MTDKAVLPLGVIRIDASGRRRYSVEHKQRLAKLTLEPRASVAGIAARPTVTRRWPETWQFTNGCR